jgi:hypothetical protein
VQNSVFLVHFMKETEPFRFDPKVAKDPMTHKTLRPYQLREPLRGEPDPPIEKGPAKAGPFREPAAC